MKRDKSFYFKQIDNFMMLKEKIIFEETGIHYYTDDDSKAIKKWDSKTLKMVYDKLKEVGDPTSDTSDSNICPFCIVYTANSKECYAICEYGINHKVCSEKESLYYEIEEFLTNSIIDFFIDINNEDVIQIEKFLSEKDYELS